MSDTAKFNRFSCLQVSRPNQHPLLMSKLAILGGEPIRKRPFSPWPQYTQTDIQRLVKVVESRHWGGFPVPSKYSGDFASRFAELHGAKYGLCLTNGTIALLAAVQALGL